LPFDLGDNAMSELTSVSSFNNSSVAQQSGSGSLSQDAGVVQRQRSQATVETVKNTVERLERATAQLNEFMRQGQRSLNFSVDQQSNEVIVRVVDKTTGDLVRQIPTPEALKIAEHIEGVVGVLFNRQA